MDNDAYYLRLLSIFHFVVGGLAAFFGCLPFLYVGFGIGILTGTFDEKAKEPPPEWVGWFLIGLGAFLVALAWVFAACVVLAGCWLGGRRHYFYCFVMACIECIFSPFGTVLGVFTIIVLLRPSVKSMFGLDSAPPQAT